MERFSSASGAHVNEACVAEVRTFTAANALRFSSAFAIAASAAGVSRRCFFPSALRAGCVSTLGPPTPRIERMPRCVRIRFTSNFEPLRSFGSLPRMPYVRSQRPLIDLRAS
jgi:hypothetical protein